MMVAINVPPLGWFARTGDKLMTPIMYLLSGTFSESPQQTHIWNNKKLSPREISHLKEEGMVSHQGDPLTALDFRFHMPILDGWKNYVVLKPVGTSCWHVGWLTDTSLGGISQIPLGCPVRVLIGPSPVKWFGVDLNGEQIPIREIATGRIGDRAPYAKHPLL